MADGTGSFQRNVGNALADLRYENGMSQEKLAEEAGMATSTVHRYEAGLRNMSLEASYKLTKPFGKTPNDLIEGQIRDDESEKLNELREIAEKLIMEMGLRDLEVVVRMMKGVTGHS